MGLLLAPPTLMLPALPLSGVMLSPPSTADAPDALAPLWPEVYDPPELATTCVPPLPAAVMPPTPPVESVPSVPVLPQATHNTGTSTAIANERPQAIPLV